MSNRGSSERAAGRSRSSDQQSSNLNAHRSGDVSQRPSPDPNTSTTSESQGHATEAASTTQKKLDWPVLARTFSNETMLGIIE
jgi:hypothetical protein